MKRKILFSPVGGTDPIKYFRDGSMLHICRYYKPDEVYLYMSQEILENHRNDNRYVDALEKLGVLLKHKFEIHIIEREGLVDVQQYDLFYMDFRNIIREIEAGMDKEDELILNMASGTPAMKSALLVMATLNEYRFKAIQVSTPKKKMNLEFEERKDYDNDTIWELNEDNETEAENRCVEVKCFNLMKLLKIDMIKKHLKAYDYTAALSVAEEIRDDITESAYELLKIADCRVKLNSNEINRINKGKYDIFPIKDGGKQKIFEYALVLQTKIQKKEYADFIRGITPLVVDLLENILKHKCNIRLEDYIIENNGAAKWDMNKLKGTELEEALEEAFKERGGFHGGVVYSEHLTKIICASHQSIETELQQKVEEIVNVEKKTRNIAAHEIVSVTDEWFHDKTGKSFQSIYTVIKYLIRESGINVKEEDWKSYDYMNDMIIKELV